MASADKITVLRGMRDAFSAEVGRRRRAQHQLEGHLRLYNYLPVDLPILEHTELYLRKSGEDISARLFEFYFKNRRIALRPEMTASVVRAYSARLRDEPLPIRVQYSGPVFRYEKPQRNRYRQFTMTGAELLGAGGALADAELLHVACRGLERLGIRDYRLVIGHSGALEGFLRRLGLRRQLHNHLLRNMENLRKRGLPYVAESLKDLFPEFEIEPDTRRSQADDAASQPLIDALRQMTDADARGAIADFLQSLNIRIAANRDQSEVIDRLLHKIREDAQAPKLRVALDYMERLAALQGAPADVLPQWRALAAEHDLAGAAITNLEDTVARLADFGALTGEIELDLGMHRGLHYYTGLMFEIHAAEAQGEPLQLCGGGRYDNLFSLLGGGERVPAAGFAYGVERIARLRELDAAARDERAIHVLPIAEADIAPCLQIANALRECNLAVEVALEGKSLRRRLKTADRKGAAIVVIIGEAERARQKAIARVMSSGRELEVAFGDLPQRTEELLQAHD